MSSGVAGNQTKPPHLRHPRTAKWNESLLWKCPSFSLINSCTINMTKIFTPNNTTRGFSELKEELPMRGSWKSASTYRHGRWDREGGSQARTLQRTRRTSSTCEHLCRALHSIKLKNLHLYSPAVVSGTMVANNVLFWPWTRLLTSLFRNTEVHTLPHRISLDGFIRSPFCVQVSSLHEYYSRNVFSKQINTFKLSRTMSPYQ